MFFNDVMPMLRAVPLGLVPVTGSLPNVKNCAIGGATVKVHKEVHEMDFIQPPLPWLTPSA